MGSTTSGDNGGVSMVEDPADTCAREIDTLQTYL
jgi:hypothetical protein